MKAKVHKLDKMVEKDFFETSHFSDIEGDNQSSAINNSDNVIISEWAVFATTSINLIGIISGTICNSLVIMTIIMTKKLLNTSINRAVLNLCLADLLVILVDVPLTTVILIANNKQYFLVSRIL